MIIVDKVADIKLNAALEKLKLESGKSRCVYFQLQDQNTADAKEKVIEAARHHFVTTSPYCYFCEDGDIFILAPEVSVQQAKQFMLTVAGRFGLPVDDSWAGFYETPLHIDSLLAVVDAKLEKRRAQDAALNQAREQAQAEKKRQSILQQPATTAKDIAASRAGRTTPELMIIEDDTFSLKLVEKVLAKQFKLTALETADKALATYVRLAPDLLFLDINLPDVTGHELLEKIVALDPNAYVIMLSGNADKENIMQAMEKGAKGFVGKPFTREKLFQYIDRCPTIKH